MVIFDMHMKVEDIYILWEMGRCTKRRPGSTVSSEMWLLSWLGLYNTLTASLQGGETPLPATSVLDMTLNNLMLRFQWCWSFGGMWSTSSLTLLPGPLWPGVVAPDRVLSVCRIELNWIAWNRAVLTFNCV